MLAKVKQMLGISPKRQPKAPDAISASVAITIQRNEAAGLRARAVLEEMLARNDGLRGVKK